MYRFHAETEIDTHMVTCVSLTAGVNTSTGTGTSVIPGAIASNIILSYVPPRGIVYRV